MSDCTWLLAEKLAGKSSSVGPLYCIDQSKARDPRTNSTQSSDQVARFCPWNKRSVDPFWKQDKETWIDLAEESRQMGDSGWENIAIWCYRNAYRQSGDGNLKIMIGNLYLKTEQWRVPRTRPGRSNQYRAVRWSLDQWTLALSSFKEALKYLPPELGNEALKESFYFESTRKCSFWSKITIFQFKKLVPISRRDPASETQK